MSVAKEFTKGIFSQNPTFKQALGLCPTLAVSASAQNGLGMGIAATLVLIGSNMLISLIRKGVPNKIRIPVYIVVIATFVTIIDLSMAGFQPDLHKQLGIFVPLIVVNCIILGRAEAYAGKNNLINSLFDALGMGLGFTWALVLLGIVREILGSGSLFGVPLFGPTFEPVLLFILPPGAFLTMGVFMGLFNWLEQRKASK